MRINHIGSQHNTATCRRKPACLAWSHFYSGSLYEELWFFSTRKERLKNYQSMKKDVRQKILGVIKMTDFFFLCCLQNFYFQYLLRPSIQPSRKWQLQEVFTGVNINSSILQGHKRKNWKVRKFVLRAEPAFLHYYDPTKVCECGVGTLINPLPDLNIIMKRQHSHAINVSLSQISWIPLLMSWEIRPLWPYSRRLSLYDFLSLCSLPIVSSLRFPFLSCGAAV